MIVVSCGLGTNSIAMLIGMKNRNIVPDYILFSDTGGEKPHTYNYIKIFNEWLISVGFPQITILKATGKTLEQDCLDRKALPSIAYGFKTCSQRWKAQPQIKFMNGITKDYEKWIGFDADEPQRAKDYKGNVYPLIEWGWGRDECIDAIKKEGLPLPNKSACFFCPSSRVSEIKWLSREHPDLAKRAIEMEKNADLTHISGLGRSFSWANVLSTNELFEDSLINLPCECFEDSEPHTDWNEKQLDIVATGGEEV